MNKNEFTIGVVVALLMASSQAIAESDYPAANFEPKVVYSNPEYKEGADAPAESASKPATAAVSAEEADPNYPAANFQPKVVYSDSNYKHQSAAPSAGSSKQSAAAEVSSAAEEVSASDEKPASSNTSLIGLLVLAAAGFFVYSKKSGGKAAQGVTSEAYSSSNDDATGVEKYLDKLGVNKTGVAKYLEKQSANPSTGVAKYMAKQIVKDREAAAARATGVEKYLRDKG